MPFACNLTQARIFVISVLVLRQEDNCYSFPSSHPHQLTLTMSGSTSKPGKPVFSIIYPCHQLRMTSGKWGYVGKAPPRSSTSSSASSTSSVSWQSSTASKPPYSAPPSTMPPCACPITYPGPAPNPPQASSQQSRPSSSTPLPTSFSFLRHNTVTPATATFHVVAPSMSKPATTSAMAQESGLVHSQFTEACICANCSYRTTHTKWQSIPTHLHCSSIPRMLVKLLWFFPNLNRVYYWSTVCRLCPMMFLMFRKGSHSIGANILPVLMKCFSGGSSSSRTV